MIDLTEENTNNGLVETENCSICLSAFKKGEELRLLPCPGTHIFHKECVDDWLKLNDSCPCCRQSIFSPESERHLFELAQHMKTLNRSSNERSEATTDIELNSKSLQIT